MDFNAALMSFMKLHDTYGSILDNGLLVFSRLLAFFSFAPIFNRKDVPFMVKLIFAMFVTINLLWVIPIDPQATWTKGNMGVYIVQLMMNAIIGGVLGFIGDVIFQAAHAAGDMMNNQIGLSSAMIFDPSSRKQVVLLESLFGFITALVFMNLGGMHWLILALQRSFTLFPLHAMQQPLIKVINMQYLVTISGNILLIAVELIAPVFIITLAIDITLGIVNRTAQQMPVFQLSFALKPAIGIAVMLATLPIFINSLVHFLSDYGQFY